jgi:hypothetical protein
MPNHATGPFEVKLTPQPTTEAGSSDSGLGRMTIAKQFHGELEATSQGEMLTAMSSVPGSGVYVAVERVTGRLGGRSGSFMLHHTGVMNRGVPQLAIAVVPDSGTDELSGLTGKLNIRIEPDGKHFYEFEYDVP